MGDRKWEDLPVDCLVTIFTKVGLVSLVEDVPYVCKPWYKATLSPLCWQSLMFHDLSDFKRLSENIEQFSTGWISLFEAFVKYVIRRSSGSANAISFSIITKDIVKCFAKGCPSLEMLMIPTPIRLLGCGQLYILNSILSEISIHCKNFKSLTLIDCDFDEILVSAIVSLLPNIEYLCMKGSVISQEDLIVILKGCKKLVHLDVSDCIGIDVDEEIQSLAAHVANFNFEGSGLGYIGFFHDFCSLSTMESVFANNPIDFSQLDCIDSSDEYDEEQWSLYL